MTAELRVGMAALATLIMLVSTGSLTGARADLGQAGGIPPANPQRA